MKTKFYLFITSLIFTSQNLIAQDQTFPDITGQSPSNSIGFIQNVGQVRNSDGDQMSNIYFHSFHSTPKSYYFNNKISFVLPKVDNDTNTIDTIRRIDMSWYGESIHSVTPYSYEETSEKVNYYLSYCSSGCDQLSKFRGLLYQNIYDNIDLRVYSNNTWLKLYFVSKPGSDPDQICLKFEGADNISVSSNLIVVSVGYATIYIPAAVAYQVDDGGTTSSLGWTPQFNDLGGGIVQIQRSGNAFDNSKALVYMISGPQTTGAGSIKNLTWSTTYGDAAAYWDVDINSNGDPHVCGYTNDIDFPATWTYLNYGGGNNDMMIIKFDANNLKVSWSTFYGGTKDEGSFWYGISLDNVGNSFVSCYTFSDNIPLLSGGSGADPIDQKNEYANQVLARFNASGQLTWATYFGSGGANRSVNGDIIVNKSTNDIYMSADDASAPTKTMTGAYNNTTSAHSFIVKFNSSLQKQWCAFIGNTVINSLEIDRTGRLLATGYIGNGAGNLPIPPGGQPSGSWTQSAYGGGGEDGFVLRFNTSQNIDWSTYLGGSNSDEGMRILTTPFDKIVVAGYTESSSNDFPTCSTSVTGVYYQPNYFGNGSSTNGDGTLTIFDFNGARENSSYLGGSRGDFEGTRIALASNSGGNIFSGASTFSNNFIQPSSQSSLLYTSSFQPTYGGPDADMDAIIIGYNRDFVLNWSTFIGGTFEEEIYSGQTYGNYLYYVGMTRSTDFPLVNNVSTSYPGGSGFLLRFDMGTTLKVKEITNESNNIHVYPNPISDKFYLSSNTNSFDNIRVLIYNSVGAQIKKVELIKNTKKQIEIEVGDVPEGLYFVEILDITNNAKSYFKLIKN